VVVPCTQFRCQQTSTKMLRGTVSWSDVRYLRPQWDPCPHRNIAIHYCWELGAPKLVQQNRRQIHSKYKTYTRQSVCYFLEPYHHTNRSRQRHKISLWEASLLSCHRLLCYDMRCPSSCSLATVIRWHSAQECLYLVTTKPSSRARKR
jgi:hypothetical protein